MTSNGMAVTFDAREGSFKPWWSQVLITVHGWTDPATALRDGKRIATTADTTAQTIAFTIPAPVKASRITIAR